MVNLALYTQGSEAFKGDLYFYSVDHDLRSELQNIDGHKCPVIMLTGTYDYLTSSKQLKIPQDRLKEVFI